MKIPESIRIGGVEYTIERGVIDLNDGLHMLMGQIHYSGMKILISDKCENTQQEALTLLHEILHGIARDRMLEIRNKLLTPEQYREYVTYCSTNRHDALGQVLFMQAVGYADRFVANLFSQNAFNNRHGTLTNYSALRTCLERVEKLARAFEYTVALPGYIGCGIAGGDWKEVRGIIEDVFGESPVNATLYFL